MTDAPQCTCHYTDPDDCPIPWHDREADAAQQRPAVTDTERRIRETVEGKGAMKHMSAEARLRHIAGLLGVEYVPTEKLPGWKPPAVTDEQVDEAMEVIDAAMSTIATDWPSRATVRAAVEAATRRTPKGA